MIKKLRAALRSRTIRFAILLAALSALQGFVVAIPIDARVQALLGFAISVVIIVLRYLTKSPVGQ